MPDRLIRESWCASETIDRLTPFEETVLARLIVNCDDFGRMDGRANVLCSRLFVTRRDVGAEQMRAAIAALAVSGALMQGVFRNPMAEPGLLGVSSGAALGAAAAMLLNLQASFWGFSAVSLCAFAGGALAVLLVMGIAGLGRGGLTTLLLCGVAVSSFLSALLSGLVHQS